jgi:hypothetical protein
MGGEAQSRRAIRDADRVQIDEIAWFHRRSSLPNA